MMLNPLAAVSASVNQPRLPHNLEAEQALLGAILVDNRAYDRVSEIISASDFFDPLHGRIFDEAAILIQAGRLVSPIALKPLFDYAEPISQSMTVPQYLGRLAANATTIINAAEYAKTVRELADRRSLILIGDDLSASALEATADGASTGLIEDAESKLFELAERRSTSSSGVVSFSEALRLAIDQANQARKMGFSGLSTGIRDLDKKLGGLRRTDLIILAARPSMGKTALATNIAYNIAKNGMTGDDGVDCPAPVGFFSLEMSKEQLSVRVIAAEAEIPGWKITQGHTTEADMAKLMQVQRQIQTIPLHIDERGGISIGQLAARARRMKRQHRIELLVVDYLQLLAGSKSRSDNRVQELTQITTGLKALAKELNIPIIALSQLSRQVETREDKRPQLSDLRESGSIEQDADVVIFVYREEYYIERQKPDPGDAPAFREWQDRMQQAVGKAEAIIGKQRHGPVGIIELAFQSELTRFTDLAATPDNGP